MRSFLAKTLVILIIAVQARASIVISIFDPAASLMIAEIGVISGGVVLLSSIVTKDDRVAEMRFNIAGALAIMGILLDNKQNKIALTPEVLGFDASELVGMNINPKLSANQLYHDLQWQRDARGADISDEKLAFYADHLNGKSISQLIKSKLEEI
jgi:hypothetical protein